jgi:hypothetical protein
MYAIDATPIARTKCSNDVSPSASRDAGSPDDDSRVLARALYEMPLTFAKTKIEKKAVRFEMARRSLGDESVDQLGLPNSSLRGCCCRSCA